MTTELDYATYIIGILPRSCTISRDAETVYIHWRRGVYSLGTLADKTGVDPENFVVRKLTITLAIPKEIASSNARP